MDQYQTSVFPAKGLAPQSRDPGRWIYHPIMPLRHSTWIPGLRASHSPGKTNLNLRTTHLPGKTHSNLHTTHSPGKIHTGYTLLELLAVISIISILSGIAINHIQKQVEKQTLKHDTSTLLHTLETAKNLAIMSQMPQEIIADDHNIIINSTHYRLSGKNHITLARFPKTTTPSIRFISTGYTDTQNGTFTLSSPHGYQTHIVINQGGRVYAAE